MIGMLRCFSGTEDAFLITWAVFLGIALILVIGSGIYLLLRGKLRIHQIFFITVFGMGVIFSFVLPPLSAPDEVLHYVGAYQLSSQIMGHPHPLRDEKNQLMIRREDVFIDDLPDDGDPDNATVVGMHLEKSTYEELHKRGLLSTGESGYTYTLQQPVVTIPCAYLFPAIGFTIARLLKLGGFGMLYLGRFMNLLLFTLMGMLAVRKTPIGKELIFGVSLFPMVLELVSSLSYDTYILALGFYLTATILELALSDRQIRWQDAAEIGILAVLLSPCKMVYCVLFAACLIIPARKWKNPGYYLATIALIGGLIVLSIVLVNFSQFFRYVDLSGTTATEAEWAGEGAAAETYSLMGTLKTPVIFLKILRNTFQIKGVEYLLTMVGHWMGGYDPGLTVSVPIVIFFIAAVLLLSVSGTRDEPKLGAGKRLWLFVTVLLLIVLLLTSMLVAYTPKGTDYALGVQGRYFLPALPMLLIALRGRWMSASGSKSLSRLVLSLELLMNGYILLNLYTIVCQRV
jgi:uncharacterized membrane protein